MLATSTAVGTAQNLSPLLSGIPRRVNLSALFQTSEPRRPARRSERRQARCPPGHAAPRRSAVRSCAAGTNLQGREGAVLARTFGHSIVLTLLLVLIVVIQQYWLTDSIPSYPLLH